MSQDIDESIVKDVGEYVPFLDIQFCFNKDGDLQTDLYQTDRCQIIPELHTRNTHSRESSTVNACAFGESSTTKID